MGVAPVDALPRNPYVRDVVVRLWRRREWANKNPAPPEPAPVDPSVIDLDAWAGWANENLEGVELERTLAAVEASRDDWGFPMEWETVGSRNRAVGAGRG